MILTHPKFAGRAPWRLLLGLLCLALLVVGSTVAVAHTHPGGEISHADCSLCATAHMVAQVVSQPLPVLAASVVARVHDAAVRPKLSRISTFALFTRPPPVALKLA